MMVRPTSAVAATARWHEPSGREGWLFVVLSELQRARAAERRYDELSGKKAGAAAPRTAASRRVFEEFYE